jgi:hypothetical protein
MRTAMGPCQFPATPGSLSHYPDDSNNECGSLAGAYGLDYGQAKASTLKNKRIDRYAVQDV